MGNIGRRAAAASALVLAAAVVAGCRGSSAEHFGEPVTAVPEVSVAQLLEPPDAFRRQPVRVRGVIERQCPSSGCWVYLRDDQGRSIRVELSDYFPRLPSRVGAEAEVEGEWIAKGNDHEFIGSRISFRREGSR